jgi:hypothetical protein
MRKHLDCAICQVQYSPIGVVETPEETFETANCFMEDLVGPINATTNGTANRFCGPVNATTRGGNYSPQQQGFPRY